MNLLEHTDDQMNSSKNYSIQFLYMSLWFIIYRPVVMTIQGFFRVYFLHSLIPNFQLIVHLFLM